MSQSSLLLQGKPLTMRELEVAALVAEGLTDAQIATRLHVASSTVRFYVDNILRKLPATSRVAICRWWYLNEFQNGSSGLKLSSLK